jgi:hypothetical protein
MKKLSAFLIIALFSILSIKAFSQSVWFVNPTNGLDITNLYSESQVSLNFQYNWQRSSNPNLITYYIKLFADPIGTYQSNQGGDIPQWFYLTPGTYQWRLELWEGDGITGSVKTAEQTITFNVKHTFTVKNNFGYGTINVDGVLRNSPYQLKKFTGDLVAGGAIDQVYNNNSYIWNQSGVNNSNWGRGKLGGTYVGGLSQLRDYTYTLVSDDNGAALIANLRKIVKPNFQNSFTDVGNGGVIKINNTQYNSPTSQFDVIELNPITATAVYQVINEIGYSFHHWNDGSTTATKTFYPGNTQTYTAYYTGKPLTTNRALRTGTVYNQPIVLYWNEHPNINVTQYQIWRKVKHNGVMSNAYLIATVNRGTTSYTDYDYNLTNGYTSDLLYYDVRPYYSIDGTYSDPNWMAVFGELMPKILDSTNTVQKEFENSLSNYPNPFNPATIINYSLKEDGFVSIKVYDLTGQEIRSLVNEKKQPGKYTIDFDASSLPSGIYIYTIKSQNFFLSRKMLLMK